MAGSSSSSTIGGADVDPYVLEYAVNMRWLLWYAANLLDPTIEQRYPVFIQAAATMNPIMSRLTFEKGCTLADLPFGVLRLSREAVLYLLVSDHVLGGCPPTMHAFLQRALVASASRKPVASRPLLQPSPRPPRKGAAHPDLNVSFPSADSDGDDGDDVDGTRYAAAGTASPHCVLDARPLAAIDPASDDMAALADVDVMNSAVQAMLLLLRWLFSEGVLAEEELAATLELGGAGADDVRAADSATAQREEFGRHRQLALHLAKLVPFFLGAHLLLTRSLLLQYSATLLTCEGVLAHVTQLRSGLPPRPQRRLPPEPPRSVEGALLEWFQVVVDSIRFAEDGAAVLARMRACAPLQAFVQHGPFCADTMEPADRDFFRLVQSGECVCVALLFYYPDTVPLGGLATALREGAAYFETGLGKAMDAGEARERLLQHQSICYWTAAAAAAHQLGVSLLLSPGEVVAHGHTALPLHLFRFVQQLFAVLATNAEEDVRVSADTAWWEAMRSSDGLSARMRSAADAANVAATGATLPSSSSFSGAQQVLRRSVSGAFPPSALVRQSYPVPETEAEQVRMGSARRGQPTDDDKDGPGYAGVEADAAVVEREVTMQEELASLASGADVAGAGHRAGFASNMDSDEAGSLTEFSIKLARTQRDGHRGDGPPRDAAVETATSVLRPMVRGRNSSRTSAAFSASATAATASVDSLAKLATEPRRERSSATPQRTTELGTYAVDTYVKAEEEAQRAGRGSSLPSHHDNYVQVAHTELTTLGAVAPTAAETLLHVREVQAALPEMAARAPAAHAEPETLDTDATATAYEATEAVDEGAEDVGVADVTPAPVANGVRVTAHTAPPPSRSSSSSLTQSVDFVVRRVAPALEAAAENASGVSDLRRRGEGGDEAHTPSAAPPALTRRDYVVEEKSEEVPAVFVAVAPQVFESGTLASGSGSVPVVRRFAPVVSADDTTEEDNGADGTAAPLRESDDVAASSSSRATATTATSAQASASAGQTTAKTQADSTAQAPQLRRRATAPPGDLQLRPTSASSSCRPRRVGDESTSSASPSVTDIAVEDDEASVMTTSLDREHGPASSSAAPPRSASEPVGWRPTVRVAEASSMESNETPRNPHTEAAAERSNMRLMPQQHLDGGAHHVLAVPDTADRQDRGLQVSVMSPSPVQPDSHSRRAGRHRGAAAPLDDSPVRGSSESGALTPLTPALTLSVSEVYGSDYASLLEGVATSEVDLLRRRHRGGEDDDSWYSSASRAYPSSLRSPAASTVSAPSAMQDTTQVRDLLERLGRVDLAELAHKDKQDLFEALAQQQAVVDQLKAALRGGRHRQTTRRGFSYSPSLRPALQRRRQVKVETPLHSVSGGAAMSPLGGRLRSSAAPRQASESVSPVTSAAASGARRRSVSAVTVESAISAARTLNSDLAGQLAETDVSSNQRAQSMSASALSRAPSP